MRRSINFRSGSALISTLLAVVVLTIIVTAFLQSMTAERRTARSYLSLARADFAADAGVAESINLLQTLFTQFPDSSTAWSNFTGTEGTTFYYRTEASSNGESSTTPSDPAGVLFARPLISGGTAVAADALTDSTGFANQLDPASSLDMNLDGWIDPSPSQPSFRAEWIELLEDPNAPEDLTFDQNKRRAVNGPIERYAYWVEDESFRVNVNVAGADERGTGTLGESASELVLQAVADSQTSNLKAADIVTSRSTMPNEKFISPSQILYSGSTSLADKNAISKYLTTVSSSLNLSRSGAKRLNLNEVVSSTIDPLPIRAQLDRIISAITNPDAMPDFGQRFYQFGFGANGLNGSSVTAKHQAIYLQKIAANIRDYIDTDSQPTVVLNISGNPTASSDFPVEAPSKPQVAYGFNVIGNNADENDAVAIGKEAVPELVEYALRIKVLEMNPSRKNAANTATGASYKFELDQYFEFFNSTNEDIDVTDFSSVEGQPPSGFLRIYNQFGMRTNTTDILPGRPFEIELSEFVDGSGNQLSSFPAGSTVVLTTDSNPATSLLKVPPANVFRPTPAALERIKAFRVYEGTTKDASGTNGPYRVFPLLGQAAGRGGSSSTDYEGSVLLGNSAGVITGFTALPIPYSLSIQGDSASDLDVSRNFFRGGSLRGNGSSGTLYQTGDARSLNEQLWIQRYRSGGDPDQTRFYNSGLNNNSVPDDSSVGEYNDNYVDPTNWPDWTSRVPNSASTAPAIIANSEMKSIGELGHIYDPSRKLRSNSATGAQFARGGGRSLRIGQSEKFGFQKPYSFGLWDGNQNSVSRNRSAWRLTDVFGTTDAIEIPGLININGVARDDGVALRAALLGIQFAGEPTSSQSLANGTPVIDELIKAALNRFPSSTAGTPAADMPFLERGGISELAEKPASGTTERALFSDDTAFDGGRDLEETLDRGREEIVRRIIELISTKGNVFSVYSIGQAISVDASGTLQVAATQRRKTTFKLSPIFDPELPPDSSFDVTAEASTRFSPPVSYSVQILSTQIE